MRSIAIIPARSGSKGLRDKNIKDLCGRPLLAYSIEAAKQSGCFDTIMVSTDSEKYAEVARQWGAEVPFLRSSETSGDTDSSWAVVREVLAGYENLGQVFGVFALLQPTTPLRTAEDIKTGFELMHEKEAGAVVAVCEAEHSCSLYNTLPDDHSFVGFIRDSSKYARQMNAVCYRLNGALYISKVDHFLSHKYIGDENCYATIMPQERSIDIDNALDFMITETVINGKYPTSRTT